MRCLPARSRKLGRGGGGRERWAVSKLLEGFSPSLWHILRVGNGGYYRTTRWSAKTGVEHSEETNLWLFLPHPPPNRSLPVPSVGERPQPLRLGGHLGLNCVRSPVSQPHPHFKPFPPVRLEQASLPPAGGPPGSLASPPCPDFLMLPRHA